MQLLTYLLRGTKDGPVGLSEEATATFNAVNDVLASVTQTVHFDPAVSLSIATYVSNKSFRWVSAAVRPTAVTTCLLFSPFNTS